MHTLMMVQRWAAIPFRYSILFLMSVSVLGQGGSRTEGRELARKLRMTPRKEQHAVITRALTWLTGGAEENDYVSVGRLANYFGFVRFRVSSGHSISRGAVGQEVYAALDGPQRERVLQLLEDQWPALEACRRARLRINRQLEGMLVGESVTLADVERLGAWFGEAEAALGLALAEGFTDVVRSLRAPQRAELASLRGRAMGGKLGRFRLQRADKAGLDERVGRGGDRRKQELWNLTSRLFTWVTGTPSDNDYDTAGKPSQHFGFVDLRVDSGHGITRNGLAGAISEILTAEQRAPLVALVDQNREDFDAFFAARAAVNRELERGLRGDSIDADAVRDHGREQGLAEARMTWRQARAFLALRDSLTLEQADRMTELRGRFTLGDPEEQPSARAAAPLEGDEVLLAGRRVFALCALCHAPQSGRGVGPSLDGVFGRRVAAVDGFAYSSAMKARGNRGERWTSDRLDAFLESPQRHTPGTIMGFTGINNPGQRESLVAYLKALAEGREAEGEFGAGPARAVEPGREERQQQRRGQSNKRAQRSEPARGRRSSNAANGGGRPNFVFVLFEGTGAGWASTSVAMDDRLPDAKAAAGLTPSLERLAREGMRFSDFYVSAPRCTPARASFLAGMSAAKLGMTYVNEGGRGKRQEQKPGRGRKQARPSGPTKLLPPRSVAELPREVQTIPEVLRDAGYATAHFGKWHVGRAAPAEHGFDVHDGANSNRIRGSDQKPNPEQAVAITDRGIRFAREQAEAGKPFYLQLSHYGGGTEDESRPETRQALAAQLRGMRGKTAWQTAILRDIDTEVGRLLDALDAAGLADDTYVVVSFDHGAAGRNANLPLAGGKGSVMEGGVRVPFFVRGPSVPAGSCSHVRASSADLLPTLAALGGVDRLPEDVEGATLARVWSDPDAAVERDDETFVLHFPHYDLGSGPASAIYRGDFKLTRRYEDGRDLLFDLRRDPGERRDLAAQRRDLVDELGSALDDYLRRIEAKLPTANPEYGK
jgi:arylsulfatase A-like enzyme/cytochrome c2